MPGSATRVAVSVTNAEPATPLAAFEVSMATASTGSSCAALKSMPQACAKNIRLAPRYTALPFKLKEKLKGTSRPAMARGQPAAVNLSIRRGIAAVDEAVATTSSSSSLMPTSSRPSRTPLAAHTAPSTAATKSRDARYSTPISFSKGSMAAAPKLATAKAMAPKAAAGAASSSRRKSAYRPAAQRSHNATAASPRRPSKDNTAPVKTAAASTCNRGLCSSAAPRVACQPGAAGAARAARCKPSPGRSHHAAAMPVNSARVEASSKYSSALTPTAPARRRGPILASAPTTATNKIGPTSRRMTTTNAVPSHSRRRAKPGQIHPVSAPAQMAATISANG